MRHTESNGDIHKIIFLISAFAMGGLLLMITTALTGYASLGGNTNISATITPNQVAAGAPIPPNYTLAQQEAK